jgi:chromosome segregation ATPase
LKISQLKSQLVQLEQDDKAYNDLLCKYRQLQNEYQKMNDAKLHLEFELKQKTENTNKSLNDLKSQNIDLANELEEKNCIYEKLLADNKNLLHNLDERKKENEGFCKTAMDNDKEINLLNEEKNRCEKEVYELDNTAKKNEISINNLCNQLDSLKIKNGKQNDELNRKNIEINNNKKSLNDLKATNDNLNNQINLKNASLDTVQNQLNAANKSINDLQKELNDLEQSLSLGQDKLQKLKIDFQNEHCKRLQAEDDNVKLESILKNRDDTVQKLSSVNDALKSDRDKLIRGKNNLLADVEKYKNHILVLTDQTQKLTNELERIISEDTEIYNLNNSQIQRLQKVIYENKKLLQDEIQALNELENYIKCQPFSNCAQGSKNVGSPSRATYSRKEKY